MEINNGTMITKIERKMRKGTDDKKEGVDITVDE